MNHFCASGSAASRLARRLPFNNLLLDSTSIRRQKQKHLFAETTMKMQSLQDLFIDELKDLCSAENQLVKALPKMAKGAASPELRTAFEEHLEQTRGHVERLEQILEKLATNP